MTASSRDENAVLSPLAVKSIIGGGLEDRRWTSALESLQLLLQKFEGVSDVPFNLTVTFVIPAEVWCPKFSGIRVASFLEDFRSLVIQVALPRHPEGDARMEVLDLLDKAIARAEAWGRRKSRLSGRLEAARRAASHLRLADST